MIKKCVNCGISNVPLYIGLDGHLHCEKHIQILVSTIRLNQEEYVRDENTKERVNNG